MFYFSLVCAIAGALTLPFAWHSPTARELTALIALGILGGLAHIFLTESYRYAAASVVAPFDYSSMLWALLLGYWLFGELPDTLVYVGATIVAAAGLFVIWRERPARSPACAREAGRRSALRPLKRLEGDDGVGVLDAGDALHLLVDEMPDVGSAIDVEFHQQVVVAGGRVDLGGDLGFGQLVGHLIGLAELAFDLDEEGGHRDRLQICRAIQQKQG